MNDPQPEHPVDPTPLEHTPSAGPAGPSRVARFVAEAFGTCLLVFGIAGTALFSASVSGPDGAAPGIGFVGVALAAGLALTVGAYAFGPVSGGHFNPAVTVGLAAAGRFPWRAAPAYLLAQLVGAVVATTVIVLIGLFGPVGWLSAKQDAGFASNGWGRASPGGFTFGAAAIVEVLLTAAFVVVILAVTHRTRGSARVAGVVIGITLMLLHLIAIPVDNASLNPARSIATAVYGGGLALAQVWAFVVFPLLGGLVGGLVYRVLFDGPGFGRRGAEGPARD